MSPRILAAGAALLLAAAGAEAQPSSATAPPTAAGQPGSSAGESGYADIATLTQAIELIRQDYVDESRVSYHDLIYSALRGMLADLDPHSQFMDPSDYEGMQEDTRSEFGGLGIVVAVRDDKLVIVSPMEDTPGFRAGLLPGDHIVKINGQFTDRLDVAGAVQLLRGEPGQRVTLTIWREAAQQLKDYELTREIIRVASVKDARLLEPRIAGNRRIGYVRITQFNEPTGPELTAKLDALEAQGLEALVIDLRFNPGGLLDSAIDVCAQFLPAGQMVVYTEGRSGTKPTLYKTAATGRPHRKYPLAILINGSSASGSEIVAGALGDLRRAVLVGETTWGKGSVQSVIQLQDGSALRLTTARYFTPNRKVINGQGVSPTIRAPMTPDEERILVSLRRSEVVTDEERREAEGFRDTQLERAADALRGLLIYRSYRDVPRTAGR